MIVSREKVLSTYQALRALHPTKTAQEICALTAHALSQDVAVIEEVMHLSTADSEGGCVD